MKIIRPLSSTEFARNAQALISNYPPQSQHVNLEPNESCLAVLIKFSAFDNYSETAIASQLMSMIDQAMSQHVGVDTMRFVAAPRPSGVHVGDLPVACVMYVGFAPAQNQEGGAK